MSVALAAAAFLLLVGSVAESSESKGEAGATVITGRSADPLLGEPERVQPPGDKKRKKKGRISPMPPQPPIRFFGPKIPRPTDPWKGQTDDALKKKRRWDSRVDRARAGTWDKSTYKSHCLSRVVRAWGKALPVSPPCTATSVEQAVGMCDNPTNMCPVVYVCNHTAQTALEVQCNSLPDMPI